MMLATITTPDLIVFVVSGAAALVGALGVITLRNPVHAALMLVMTLFSIAVLFVEEQAQFLAAVQVMVYAGAIVVLFLFVIMLLGVDHSDSGARDAIRWQRPVAFVSAVLILLEVSVLARTRWATGAHSTTAKLTGSGAHVSELARSVFTTYLAPFEATSALLIIAVVGAVVLSRTSRNRSPVRETERPESVGGSGAEEATLGSTPEVRS
jgi:NADH-quinone oxidoreductase subunit J